LDSIEKRLEGQDGERAEGLSYLFMAKQHQARGEDGSALKMYELARPYFPENEKLKGKIERLKEKLSFRARPEGELHSSRAEQPISSREHNKRTAVDDDENDASYHDDEASADRDSEDERFPGRTSRPKKQAKPQKRKARTSSPDPLAAGDPDSAALPTPRTQYLLDIINSRDIAQIKSLNGLGVKRAEGIVEYLDEQAEDEPNGYVMRNWNDLSRLRGIGKKTLESMREGVLV
jgi:hypothetical protein